MSAAVTVAARSPLAEAIIRAVGASDQVAAVYQRATDEAITTAAESEAYDARAAVYAEFNRLGVSKLWLERLGLIL